MKALKLVGHIFGKWLVIAQESERKHNRIYWSCKCTCGAIKSVSTSDLRTGASTMCKPCSKTGTGNGRYSHGQAGSRLHHIWTDMLGRCRNPKDTAYEWYGAKGVTVCAEWEDFRAFEYWAASNGYRDNLTIDRIKVSKNYEPDNCQWLTKSENSTKARTEDKRN